jgi:hypothetical protein
MTTNNDTTMTKISGAQHGRVLADGGQAGLSVDRGTMRIELVATIQREAVEACSTLAATEWHLAGREAA